LTFLSLDWLNDITFCHRGQHCRADVCTVWLQPSCSEHSGAECWVPHIDTVKLSASLLRVEELALWRLDSTCEMHVKLWLQYTASSS
jgi:hypothetical protein